MTTQLRPGDRVCVRAGDDSKQFTFCRILYFGNGYVVVSPENSNTNFCALIDQLLPPF